MQIAPWKSRHVLLIAGSVAEGWEYANTVGDKRLMLSTGGPLIAVWPGQWSTTARIFGPGDHKAVRDLLG